ncbi:MAG: PorP/SprF family type IX secretion system membrane protein [Cryomorphaceae bacterium]
MKSFSLVTLLTFLMSGVFGQEVTPIQTLLSPGAGFIALTGYHGAIQTSLQYRNQWPGIPSTFVNYDLTVDAYLPSVRSGIGLALSHDRTGSGQSQINGAQLNLSHRYLIKKASLLGGLSYQYSSLRLDWQCFYCNIPPIYPMNTGGIPVASTLPGHRLQSSVGVFVSDFLFLYQVGYSTRMSPFKDEPNYERVTHSAYAAYRFALSTDVDITPSANFRRDSFLPDDHFNALTLACNARYKFLQAGALYRWGDAAGVQMGAILANRCLISYSYDITVSSLGTQTLGSHELGLRLTLNKNKAKDVLVENLWAL